MNVTQELYEMVGKNVWFYTVDGTGHQSYLVEIQNSGGPAKAVFMHNGERYYRFVSDIKHMEIEVLYKTTWMGYLLPVLLVGAAIAFGLWLG